MLTKIMTDFESKVSAELWKSTKQNNSVNYIELHSFLLKYQVNNKKKK